MSLFFGAERRIFDASLWTIPPNSQAGTAGTSANLASTEASLQKIAVWASVALLAGTGGMLPIDAYTGKGAAKREIDLPNWMEDPAGDGHGLGDWIYQLITSYALRGNGYGLVIGRDRTGLPTQVVLQHPDDVSVRRDQTTGMPQWRVSGETVSAAEMWHSRAHPMPGRLLGLSPIAHHMLTIGLGLSVLRFANQWFDDGAHPTGLLKTTGALDEKKARVAKARFLAAVAGRREPLVLGGDWEFKPIQIAPEESQFLETSGMTSAECCRIFGPGLAEIIGYETGGSMTYQNIEQRNLQLLIYALDPHLTRIERALTRMLPPGIYVRFNRAALLRTDIITRFRAYQLAIRNHIQAPSEARELEDLPPMTDAQHAEFTALLPAASDDTASDPGGTQ
ncbi:phage portal protein [Streptosporangium sp. CA-135522]|uniref:phage portal protein n=1 Tax=Streptosporangium sp. CA-135522 TaxID=3240072 RepID=UPI003D8A88CA